MKKQICLALIVVVVLSTAWTVFAQREGGATGRRGGGAGLFMMTAEQRERWRDMSEEERTKLREEMRQRWENMSEEEREKARAQMRERFGGRGRRLGREDQLKAIEDIEKQLAINVNGILSRDAIQASISEAVVYSRSSPPTHPLQKRVGRYPL